MSWGCSAGVPEPADDAGNHAWSADVAVGPYAGSYHGTSAQAWWGPNGLQTLALSGVNGGPAPHVAIQFYLDRLGYSAPGTYTPPPGVVEINFSLTAAVHDPGAEQYFLNHGGPPRQSSAPWNTTTPPDPITSVPIAFTFEELSEDRVKGTVSGQFFHLAQTPEPGFLHSDVDREVTGDVKIRFDLVPCSPARRRARSAAC